MRQSKAKTSEDNKTDNILILITQGIITSNKDTDWKYLYTVLPVNI